MIAPLLALVTATASLGTLVAPSAAASDLMWEWGVPASLSSPGFAAYSPSVALSSNGARASVAWIEDDGTRNRTRVTASSDGGDTWDDSTALSAAGQNADSVDLAMSGDGLNLGAVWRRYNGSHWIVQGSGSSDGGVTWASPSDLSLAGATTYRPSVALSSSSTRRIAVWHRQGSPDVVQAAVADDSSTWVAPVTLSSGSGNATAAAAAVSANGQQLVTLWSKLISSPSQLQSATSSDGGSAWSAPTTFPQAPGGPGGQTVAMSEDGRKVVAAWTANDGTDQRVFVRTSDDSGTTWNAVGMLSAPGAQATSPQVALSADGTGVAVSWSVGDAGRFATQIAMSRDGGQTWGAPISLDSDARTDTQSLPLMSADAQRLAVVWSDYDGSQYSIQTSASFNSGVTWSDPLVISEATANGSAPVAAMAADGSRLLYSYTTSGGAGTVIVRSATIGAVPVPPSPAPPPVPSSEPLDVAAVAGDASALVSWSAPASSGSFPVTYYLATSAPGGRTCLTSGLSCTVAGLTNGTAYTFRVQALNGAGWSVSSEPSNAVTPAAVPRPTITITGAREGKRITVSGTTTGMGMGAILRPWVRLAGQSAYAQGSAEVLVSMNGTFAWSRRAGREASVYMQTQDGSVRSNTVTIR